MNLIKFPNYDTPGDVFINPAEVAALVPHRDQIGTCVVLHSGHQVYVGLSTTRVEKSVRVALEIVAELAA